MIFENLAVKNVKSAIKTESRKDREVIGTAYSIDANIVMLNHLNIFQK
jgi:hypothetical protein